MKNSTKELMVAIDIHGKEKKKIFNFWVTYAFKSYYSLSAAFDVIAQDSW